MLSVRVLQELLDWPRTSSILKENTQSANQPEPSKMPSDKATNQTVIQPYQLDKVDKVDKVVNQTRR